MNVIAQPSYKYALYGYDMVGARRKGIAPSEGFFR